ncbi:tyrosine-protein phosphatase non-receptor type 2 isoform 3-T3 [Morus bassanus]
MSAIIEQEFQEIDAANAWQARYMEIRHKSSDYPHRVAKYPENRNRNRYRDVSPYDHSRVKLQNAENDYINASLVVVEEAQRYYILTQGPLPNTCCHFWLMVWQQQTKAVVMLNRIVEKESVKCAQYWPTKEEEVMTFSETGFRVRLVSEDIKSYYTVHLLQLENINERWKELSKEDQAPSSEQSPPHPTKITTEKYNGNSIGLENKDQMEKINTELSTKVQDITDGNNESTVRKRLREDRKANTAQKLQQMKQKLNETERKRKRSCLYVINRSLPGAFTYDVFSQSAHRQTVRRRVTTAGTAGGGAASSPKPRFHSQFLLTSTAGCQRGVRPPARPACERTNHTGFPAYLDLETVVER